MAMVVQHNMNAINANNKLGQNVTGTAKASEKLSSGFQINRAADNAAGLAVSEKMRSQTRGLRQATNNANDGISLIQTAEGGLNETHAILHRIRELAVQSANGTYQNETDREAMQLEVDRLKGEIDRISEATEFNGIKLLDGKKPSTTTSVGGYTTTEYGAKYGIMLMDQATSFSDPDQIVSVNKLLVGSAIISNVNGLTVSFKDGASGKGGENVVYDSANNELILNLKAGTTYTQQDVNDLIKNVTIPKDASNAVAESKVLLKNGCFTFFNDETFKINDGAGLRQTTDIDFIKYPYYQMTKVGYAETLNLTANTYGNSAVTDKMFGNIVVVLDSDVGKESVSLEKAGVPGSYGDFIQLHLATGKEYTEGDIEKYLKDAGYDYTAQIGDYVEPNGMRTLYFVPPVKETPFPAPAQSEIPISKDTLINANTVVYGETAAQTVAQTSAMVTTAIDPTYKDPNYQYSSSFVPLIPSNEPSAADKDRQEHHITGGTNYEIKNNLSQVELSNGSYKVGNSNYDPLGNVGAKVWDNRQPTYMPIHPESDSGNISGNNVWGEVYADSTVTDLTIDANQGKVESHADNVTINSNTSRVDGFMISDANPAIDYQLEYRTSAFASILVEDASNVNFGAGTFNGGIIEIDIGATNNININNLSTNGGSILVKSGAWDADGYDNFTNAGDLSTKDEDLKVRNNSGGIYIEDNQLDLKQVNSGTIDSNNVVNVVGVNTGRINIGSATGNATVQENTAKLNGYRRLGIHVTAGAYLQLVKNSGDVYVDASTADIATSTGGEIHVANGSTVNITDTKDTKVVADNSTVTITSSDNGVFQAQNSATLSATNATKATADNATITLTGDGGTVQALNAGTVTANSAKEVIAKDTGSTVNIATNVSGAVQASDDAKINVTGNVGGSVMAKSGAEITVGGDIDGQLEVGAGAKVTVTGSIKGSVTIEGELTADEIFGDVYIGVGAVLNVNVVHGKIFFDNGTVANPPAIAANYTPPGLAITELTVDINIGSIKVNRIVGIVPGRYI